MDKNHSLAAYVVGVDVPLLDATYTKQYYQPSEPGTVFMKRKKKNRIFPHSYLPPSLSLPHPTGYSYIISYPVDEFSTSPPYLLVHEQEGEGDVGVWSGPIYPIGGNSFCPGEEGQK